MTEHVQVEDQGAVRVIRFNRPEKKNALTRAMYAAAAEALNDGGADKDVRCFVIAGQPEAFTAGNDLNDFMQAPPRIGADEPPPVERFMRALAGAEKPVIAAVDGLAVGIGVTMLLHCDLGYASTRASFRTPFVDLALAPEYASSLLMPARMGRAAASDLLLLCSVWDAPRALRSGLITDVFTPEALEGEVMARAEALAAKPPTAVRAAKALMTAEPEPVMERIKREGALFSDLLQSPEFMEAATAFMERRKPDFSKFG
ncbi:MAG: crotonase/enoyl-CoA hydratase family protein [Maricaulaceae bacterium]|nr:crotonase/enoyl-CoA hydratase family protein [Maricaulaceae bacterium]